MPKNDPEYMRDYQRRRRATPKDQLVESLHDESLAEFIRRSLPPEGVDAILEGARTGSPTAWRKFRADVKAGRITVDAQPRKEPGTSTAVPKK